MASNKSQIYLLFPSYTVYEDNIPEFIPKGKYVLYANSNISSDKDVIFISKCEGIDISKKDGFLKVLDSRLFLGLDPEMSKKLLSLDSNQFWKTVKIFLVHEIQKKKFDSMVGYGSYVLFEHISDGFLKTYKIYKKMKCNYNIVVSSLITMFTNCIIDDQELEEKGYTYWYISIIKENRKYFKQFRNAVLRYSLSKKREFDFFTFLAEMDKYSSQ